VGEATLLSLCTIAAIALILGGAVRWAKHRDRTRGLLMVAAALVLIGEVAIWAWPVGR
jgi:hypothetical protein